MQYFSQSIRMNSLHIAPFSTEGVTQQAYHTHGMCKYLFFGGLNLTYCL